MKIPRMRLVAAGLLSVLTMATSQMAHSQPAQARADAQRWVIEAVGTATALPDVAYLMMKMEHETAQAAEATRGGEERLLAFLTAVEELKIPNLTWRLYNNVITTARATGDTVSGFVYSRNIVFVLTSPERGQRPPDLDRTVAQLEVLGARHSSHCVTCIGSG